MESKLINMTAFLKFNHLKQQEVAEKMGISTSMMSAISNGKARLSRAHIDKLETLSIQNDWDINPLRPCYSRLNRVLDHVNKDDLFPNISGEHNTGEIYRVPQAIYDKIKYAEIEIPDSVIKDIFDLKKGINPMYLTLDDSEMVFAHYSDYSERSTADILEDILTTQKQILECLNAIGERIVSK